MNFGEHIKARRLELNLSLRAFCAIHSEDPSNWSKLERGLLQPPEQEERLVQIGGYLGYVPDSPEMRDFLELASIGRGEIPRAILAEPALMEKLPLVFRTLRESPTESELIRLAELVRGAHSSDA